MYRTVRTVVWEDGAPTNGAPPTRLPGMAHTLGVKVPGAPGSGKRVADGKGVRREAESEGSRRRNLGPRNTNRIRRAQGVRLPNKPKPDSCTEPADVDAAGA